MDNFVVIFHSMSMMCALIFVLSHLYRRNVAQSFRVVTMGVACGFVAVVAMLDPIMIDTGVQIDGRNLFIGIAGVLGGFFGAIIAAAVAIIARVIIGGVGVPAGVAGILLCAAVGAIWSCVDKRGYLRKRWRWPAFGAMLCLSIPSLLLLPVPIGSQAIIAGGPYLLLVYLLGALLVGVFLNKEFQFLLSYETVTRDSEIDPLTGALNRRGFTKGFAQKKIAEGQISCLVMMLDVDRFKLINDNYGHDVGDRVLVAVATRVKSVLRSNDLVARVGGDEFAVCVFDLTKEQAQLVVQKVMDCVKFDLDVGHMSAVNTAHAVKVETSVGSAFYQGSNAELDQLVNTADRDMMSKKTRAKKQLVPIEAQA